MSQKTQTIDGVTSTGAPSELDALASLAAATDAEQTGKLPDGTLVEDQPQPVNYGQEAAMTVDTFAALLVGYCPDTAPLWADDKKAAVSASLAPVMEKYGFTLGALPVELIFIVTAGPLLYQSSKLVAGQMKREQLAAQAKPVARAEPAPGAVTAGPEVARHPQTALYQGGAQG